MFHKMPFILVAVILAALFFGDSLPIPFQSTLYGASLSIKSFIVFILPVIIFGLLFKTAVQFAKDASKMFLLIIGGVCLSNLISTIISYSVGSYIYSFDLSIKFPEVGHLLMPTYEIAFPKLVENTHAMFLGLLSGVFLGRYFPDLATKLSDKLFDVVNFILKIVLLFIPILVGGFVIKMNYDKVMWHILQNYSIIYIVIGATIYSYILFIYFALNQFDIRLTLKSLRNMLPAAIAGFGSMSSAVAMPLTLIGVSKNSRNPDLARSVIPATVNIHLLGDYIAIPLFAFAVMKSFGMPEPSLGAYVIFAAYYFLAKFSVAAVPGGVILVMLPILETYLGFTAEMLSLLAALSILFDSVITGANILGNGALVMAIDKVSSPAEIKEITLT